MYEYAADTADVNGCCPECGGRLRAAERERVCEDCGLVAGEDRIDRGPEWRSFDEGTPAGKRTGAPLTRSRHDRGLSTEIGFGGSTRLTGRKRRQLARLRREHNRARISTKADRNRVYGFTEIRRLVSQLSLPPIVREQGCALFESAQEEGLLQGRSLEGFAAAAVYAVCRIRSFPRTMEEIVGEARADRAELRAAYDALNRDLGLPTGPIDPGAYLPRYASKLGLDTDIERDARAILERLEDEGAIGGRNPSGVAGACLYAAAREADGDQPITQDEAASVAGVSSVTIRSAIEPLEP